jgi:hypothetical protein
MTVTTYRSWPSANHTSGDRKAHNFGADAITAIDLDQ